MVSLTIANSRAVICHSHAVITTYCHPFPLFYFRTFPLWVALFFSYCSPESQYFELSHYTVLKPSFHRSLTSALFPPAEVSIPSLLYFLFTSDCQYLAVAHLLPSLYACVPLRTHQVLLSPNKALFPPAELSRISYPRYTLVSLCALIRSHHVRSPAVGSFGDLCQVV
jgi:hypothetical protein